MYSVSRKPATKEEYKEEKEHGTHTWGFFFYGIYDHTEKFLWDLLSIYEDCKARTRKGFKLLRRKEHWYFF
jgi:hypothetical protein